MADPTTTVRRGTYQRDGSRCLRCGLAAPLSYQHRQAVGMGGSKIRPEWAEGLTACGLCNNRFEHDLQKQALACGWKVRGWVKTPEDVPVFDMNESTWFVLDLLGPWRTPITVGAAHDQMVAVYGTEYDEWVLEVKRNGLRSPLVPV